MNDIAEYIEREAVLKIIGDNCTHDKGGYNTEEEMGAGAACYYIRKGVDNIPTADVVPKSEVEQLKRNLEQCENGYRQEMHLLQCKLTNANSEVERLEKENEKLTINMNAYGLAAKRLAEEKADVASEIFAEIATEISKKLPLKIYCGIDGKPFNGNEMDVGRERALYEVLGFVIELKKKYAEGKK